MPLYHGGVPGLVPGQQLLPPGGLARACSARGYPVEQEVAAIEALDHELSAQEHGR
jgi:hypothetical protein